jgi:hypothetical protein
VFDKQNTAPPTHQFFQLLHKNIVTPWNRVLEKLIITQPVKKFPTFYRMQMFITTFISASIKASV